MVVRSGNWVWVLEREGSIEVEQGSLWWCEGGMGHGEANIFKWGAVLVWLCFRVTVV